MIVAASDRNEISVQQRIERFARNAPVEAPERTVVQQGVDPLQFRVENVIERASLRQHHADDAVAVLVRPQLPRMVGLREVDLETECLPELLEPEGDLPPRAKNQDDFRTAKTTYVSFCAPFAPDSACTKVAISEQSRHLQDSCHSAWD